MLPRLSGMSRPLLEFGGGSGEILRDLLHLRSVSEAEALISGAEGRDQLRHISTSLQAPEPVGGEFVRIRSIARSSCRGSRNHPRSSRDGVREMCC